MFAFDPKINEVCGNLRFSGPSDISFNENLMILTDQ